ncbi:MAG: polymer-forming cytoskeletal protein [Planctomycetota bacterium]
MSNETPEHPNQNKMSAWLDLDGRSWFELLGPMFLAIFLIILAAAGAIQLGLFDAASINPRTGIIVGSGIFVVALAIYAFTSTELLDTLAGFLKTNQYEDALDQEFDLLGDDFEDEYEDDFDDEYEGDFEDAADESMEEPVMAEEIVEATAVAPQAPTAATTSNFTSASTESIPLDMGSMPTYPEPRRRRRAVMGPKISFKGELVGEEDLLIQGNVEGVVYLNGHNLTIGNGATVNADILARNVIVEGEVTGDVVGQERIIMRSSSNVRGNVVAERIVMDDGAKIRGGIDMESDSQRSAAHAISRKVTSLPGRYYAADGTSTPVSSAADVRSSMIQAQKTAPIQEPTQPGREPKFGEPGFVDRRAVARGSSPNPAPAAPSNPAPQQPTQPNEPAAEAGKREPKFGEPGFVDRRAVPRGSAQPPVAPQPQQQPPKTENKPAVPSASTPEQSQQGKEQPKTRVIRPTIDDSNPIDEE